MDYAMTIELDLPYDQAVPRVKEAFRQQGFGTLTEIDVRATLREKIGEEVDPYVILGTCNPNALRALEAEPEVGVLLPCSVVVRARGAGTVVHALEPAVIAQVPGNPALEPIAEEAGKAIRAALADLSSGAGA